MGGGLACLDVSQDKGIDAFPGGPTHLEGAQLADVRRHRGNEVVIEPQLRQLGELEHLRHVCGCG